MQQDGTANITEITIFQGLRAHQQGNLPEAIGYYCQALQVSPSVEAYANLGVALRSQNHIQAAIVAYHQALALNPEHVPTLSNLGGAYRALGKLEQAQDPLKKAVALDPMFAAAHYNLGLVWMDSQQPQQSIHCFEEALRLEPHRTDAQFDRAVCILQQGDLLRGFEAYEGRFKYEPRLEKNYQQPVWDGSLLNGKTLLLYAEQGFGDTLQFIRYISEIEKGTNSQIILECPKELKRLVQAVPGIDKVISPGDQLPPFDCHASLLSLPYLFKTTLETIPAAFPYLKAPFYRFGLKSKQSQHLKVGLVWASGHPDVGVRTRSCPLAAFLPLLEVPGVSFFSFQKGPQIHELYDLGLKELVQDLNPLIQDFADTAALLMEMDLLISVDTSIVHLGGALNIPTWVLLPYGSEWRWQLGRTDSPWYPSVKLFRQTNLCDWSSVFHDLKQLLADIILKQLTA